MHFQPPRNEMKCVLCIKESYSKVKKGQHFEEMKKGQNVDLFTLEYDSLMHKTHFIVRGLKNAVSIITN